MQKSFSDLRVCAIAEGLGSDDRAAPSRWPDRASRLVLETQQRNDLRRLEIEGGRVVWSINGRSLPMDATAEAWRASLLDLLDATWLISQLQGQASTLRGEISTIHGQRSTLQGEISTLRGQVSTMQGQISTARGEESTLRGEISTIRGQLSTLQGQISTERGAISTLQSSRNDRYTDRDAIEAGIRRHEAAISDIEDEIRRYDTEGRVRAVQRRIDALDTDARVRAIEARIRDFDVEGRVADVNRQIAALDVDGQVNGIEHDITALDVPNRVAGLQTRRDEALARLRAVLR